jgi:predicted nucleic acid-binding protein
MYLVDTNVWLERLLDQTRSEEVGKFIDDIPSENLFITDFAFHSIGVIMGRLKRTDGLLRFVQDNFINGAVALIHLQPEKTYKDS